MSFFRPSLNQHGLTEQQWRVIRILRQQGEMESYQLANQACILRPSMTGVLARLSATASSGAGRRPGPAAGLREPECFVSMSGDMEKNYQRIQERFGEEKLAQLLELLNELKKIKP